MNKELNIKKRSNKWRVVLVIGGIASNVLLFFISNRLKLPFFLDTAGTLVAAGLGGLFPGILTAVVSNTICAFIDSNSLYFMIVNVLLAIYAAWYARRHHFNNIKKTLLFALIAGFASGLLGAVIQIFLFGGVQNSIIKDLMTPMQENLHIPESLAFRIGNVLVNLLDKIITTTAAFCVISFAPPEEVDIVRNSGWRQRPLTVEELKSIKKWGRDVKLSARLRMTFTLIGMSLILVFIMGWIGVSLYFEVEENSETKSAWNTVQFTSSMMEPATLRDLIKNGRNSENYEYVKELLTTVKKNAYGIQNLYMIRPEGLGVRFIVDLPSESKPVPFGAGQLVPYEDTFIKEAKEALMEGVSGYLETKGIGYWKMTVYYPVKDLEGNLLCHVCADVYLSYMADYMRVFIFKVAVIMSGYFVLIVAYALWTTDVYSTYPISSMAEMLDRFSKGDDSQEQLDNNVREIRALDIRTGDETEKLYQSICSMSLNQAEQMRSIRRLSESTAKMQDGLIMTMADMVENRDLDMGAHIQRTTAFVRIILESLKKKGYYAEKLTPKFMNDVVRSAPLYDVGKIKIPDKILKKPGKLTDEEYEIIKTHVIEGKKIMENAIGTSNGDNYLKEARNMAAYHHERWDGTGYPEGLHGEVIPLSARIMAIADVFDDITSDRVYRKAYSLEEAIEIMKSDSGTIFDPKCVEAFLDAMPEIQVIMMKYEDNV